MSRETVKIEVERIKYLPNSTDPEAAFLLIRDIGFWFLSGYDGCHCGWLEICGIEISISCRKSQSTITFHTGSQVGSVRLLPLGHVILDQMFKDYESEDARETAKKLRAKFTIEIAGVKFPGTKPV